MIIRRRSALGHGVDMGIFAPAVIGKLRFRQTGNGFFRKGGLGRGFDQLDGVPVEIAHILGALAAQIAAAQQLKRPIADVGDASIGKGIDFCLGHIHLKVIFHGASSGRILLIISYHFLRKK